LPKTNPLNAPYPEVFGSISIMNMKKKLMRLKGFAFMTMDTSGTKNARKPKM
ncbi:MAG: hypothetical protein HZA30_00365, partial [Candidatus Omnitrophica bacterium]|nr:hypothetical protein [Candidatus Omnitrophota bacterium]